uniref:Uncharacterized protein n=1 Tax=Anopheles funestus TaxID=62324 RepID=A0A182S2X5_ANOFN
MSCSKVWKTIRCVCTIINCFQDSTVSPHVPATYHYKDHVHLNTCTHTRRHKTEFGLNSKCPNTRQLVVLVASSVFGAVFAACIYLLITH